MDVLFEVSPLNIGGPQAWVCDMAPALKCRGIQVEVLSFEFSAPKDRVLENRLRQGGISPHRTVLVGGAAHKMRLIYSAISRLRHCDVMHINSDALSGLFLFCAKRCGIKVRIAHSRTPNWNGPTRGWKNKCLHALFRWMARRYCTHAFGVTQPALESLVGGHANGKIPCRVVPSAISLGRYRPRTTAPHYWTDGRVVIGFVGRITPSKHPVFLVQALARIRKRGVNAELLFVGAGPAENDVWANASALQVTRHIAVLPPQEDIVSILSRQVDVLVLPSEYEGTPRVVLEAQACGIPVVCSTGVPSGVLVVPELSQSLSLTESTDAWADAILRTNGLCVPPEKISQCFARSPFDLERQADLLAELYQEYVFN